MTKKRKTLKTEAIRSADEEDEEDQIPEEFHLQEESPHCLNMQRAEDFQVYLWQLVLEFEKMRKAGGTDMRVEYGKVIESFFWVCKENKQTICNDAVLEDVLTSVKDPSCKAWKLKLNGKDSADPTTLVPEPFKKPDEILEAVKGELEGKTPLQIKELKITVANICRSQALAHRHAADAADHLVTLTEIASSPVVMTVINACQRPVVAVKIPEVDEMMQRAQDKVDAMKRVQIRTGGVVFAQNVPTYNPEWQHSNEGRATSFLAKLVCRYMNELQRKHKKVVMSAKPLEAIYHMASSSVGKLISGKQYLGGYAMKQQRGKAEAEGKELPYKRCKKLQMKDTAIPSTSGVMEHWASLQNNCEIHWENVRKRNLDIGNYRRFREKCLQTDEFVEHSWNSRKTRRKVMVWSSKLKIMYTTAKTEKIRWTRALCDACWLRFGLWGYLITTITSHHSKKGTGLVKVSLADSTDDCTGICTGNDVS